MAWQPDYASTAELREYATRSSSTVDDTELALAVTAASRAVDRHCNRQFGQVDATTQRRFTGRWDRRRGRWVVDIDDLADDTGLTVTVDGGAVDAYDLEPLNAVADGKPYTLLVVDPAASAKPTGKRGGVTVESDQWGWAAIPDPVKQATLLQGHRFAWRRTAPQGIAGSPETGSELRLLAKVDPDVATTLGPFVRWWGAA